MKLYKTRSHRRGLQNRINSKIVEDTSSVTTATTPTRKRSTQLYLLNSEAEKYLFGEKEEEQVVDQLVDSAGQWTFSFELPPPQPPSSFSTLTPFPTHLPLKNPKIVKNFRKSPRCHASTICTTTTGGQQTTTREEQQDSMNIQTNEYLWDAIHYLSDGYVVGLLNKYNPVVKLKDIFRK